MVNSENEEQLNGLIKHLKESKSPVILFGAKHMGLLVKDALEHYKIKVAGFVVNSEKEQGKTIEDVPVMSPKDLQEKFDEAAICVCSFNKNNQIAIENQLRNMGFSTFIPLKLLIYCFYTRIADRIDVIFELMNSYQKMFEIEEKSSDLILRSMNLPITEKCSLRCKDCAHLIQYYEKPVHYDKDIIIQSIKTLANTVDVIGRIDILGGEVFLYPSLGEVLEEIARTPNILLPQIITNGTILPDDKLINIIKKSGTHLLISDYGEYSSKKEQLMDVCRKNNICCIKHDNLVWYDIGQPLPRNRPDIENMKLFKACPEKENCNSLRNGEYHLCPRSAHGTNLEIIPKCSSDYIDILKPSLSKEKLRVQLKNLLNKTESIMACDYCKNYNIHERLTIIPVAEQRKANDLGNL